MPKTRKPAGPAPSHLSSRQIAKQFGISRAVQWRAKQIADIPGDQFEALIEGPNPPTVSALVDFARGKTPGQRKPADQLHHVRQQIAALTAQEEELRAGFISGELPLEGVEHVVVVERKENTPIDGAAMRKNVAEEIWRPYLISSTSDYATVRKRGVKIENSRLNT